MAGKKRNPNSQRATGAEARGQETTSPGDWHEVFAIAWGGVGLLGFLALWSFHPGDFPPWNPGSRSDGNWAGPAGVVVAAGLYAVLGAAAYVVPALAMVWAGMLLAGRGSKQGRAGWWRGGALVVWVASACCLLEFQDLIFQAWVGRYGLPGSEGGWMGVLLGRNGLERALGQPGATVLASLGYFLSLMILTGFRPGRTWGRRARKNAVEEARTAAVSPALLAVDAAPRSRKGETTDRRSKPARPGSAAPQAAAQGERRRRVQAPPQEAARERERPGPPVILDSLAMAPEPGLAPAADPPEKRRTHEGREGKRYQLPSFGVLAPRQKPEGAKREDQDQLRARQQVIIETLRTFRVGVEPGDITRGPSVTRFEFYPEPGLSVRRIAALEADIALATRAKRITILAPIPGKGTVGIEIANEVRVPVGLRELLQDGAFSDPKLRIPLALGKDVYGKPLIADLAAMPHLLIAGTTGSGKSVCLNTIIASLLYRFTPEQLRLIMIDPKVVEMQGYARLPHLAVPVVTDAHKVLAALRWCLSEMERRYRLFAEAGVRRLDEYNARAGEGAQESGGEDQGELFDEDTFFLPEAGEGAAALAEPPGGKPDRRERLPAIVVIIDELADLMQAAPAEVETSICRLCQKARAAGIHLIVATQSPRADVVTGLIKANIPARIAFQVSSGTDSRVILDKTGAERLVGKGDLLFQPPDSPVMVRAQGAFLSDEEVGRLVAHCASQATPAFDGSIQVALEADDPLGTPGENAEADEDAFLKALNLIREEKRASTSFLQRRMRLGYTRAARLMDLLEKRGVVGPAEGARPREILVADLRGDE